MPIQIKCGCGQTLQVRDELAGKAVKCPKCGKPVRVPAKKSPSKTAAATRATRTQAAPPTGGSDSLDDLFAEEGFDRHVAAVCPVCRAEMDSGAVFCTKCGYNKETGEQLAGHQVAGVDVDMGTVQLQRAEKMMARDQKLQETMTSKAGLPAWMVALILFILGSATMIAVIAVNASNREQGLNFNPLQMFMNLGGAAFALVGGGAVLSLIAKAFKKSRNEGLLSLTIVYLFYFVAKNFRLAGKTMITAILCGAISGGFFAAASSM
ncbi:MAG: zinc ribbon domain-containing protein [Planctomycetota bacterium]